MNLINGNMENPWSLALKHMVHKWPISHCFTIGVFPYSPKLHDINSNILERMKWSALSFINGIQWFYASDKNALQESEQIGIKVGLSWKKTTKQNCIWKPCSYLL